MQIVISVSEDTYKRHKWRVNHDACTELDIALAKGTPLPKGHGGLIDINELITKLEAWDYKANGIPNYAWKCIKDSQAIIEADMAESEVQDADSNRYTRNISM